MLSTIQNLTSELKRGRTKLSQRGEEWKVKKCFFYIYIKIRTLYHSHTHMDQALCCVLCVCVCVSSRVLGCVCVAWGCCAAVPVVRKVREWLCLQQSSLERPEVIAIQSPPDRSREAVVITTASEGGRHIARGYRKSGRRRDRGWCSKTVSQ